MYILISLFSGFNGDVVLDSSKFDGAMHKPLDFSTINSYGWKTVYSLEESLREAYNSYSDNLSALRR